MHKRTFLKSLMGIVATVALAPELAFGRLKMPAAENPAINRLWEDALYEVGFLFNASDYHGDCEWKETTPHKIKIWSRQAGKTHAMEQLRKITP